jgi:hypothetical protein
MRVREASRRVFNTLDGLRLVPRVTFFIVLLGPAAPPPVAFGVLKAFCLFVSAISVIIAVNLFKRAMGRRKDVRDARRMEQNKDKDYVQKLADTSVTDFIISLRDQ